jgi:uncharacterized protein YqeY
MDSKQKLETALYSAMKAGDDLAKRTIRMALSSIKFSEKEKGIPLDEIAITAILQKEIKSRQEVIQDAIKGNRIDIIDANNAEILFLETFLPPQLTEDEINALCVEVITELNAKSKSDMGKVMKVLVSRIQGRAPNDKISQLTSRLLDNQ